MTVLPFRARAPRPFVRCSPSNDATLPFALELLNGAGEVIARIQAASFEGAEVNDLRAAAGVLLQAAQRGRATG